MILCKGICRQKGVIEPFLFWYQSGVIGGTSRDVKFKPELAFETFEEAETYFLQNPLRLELRDLKGNTFNKVKIPFVKRKSAFLYPSNSKGILWNAFNTAEEDIYVTGKDFPEGSEVNLYMVSNQFIWHEGEAIKDVRGRGAFLKTIKIENGQKSFTVKIENKGNARLGSYDVIARINGNPRDLKLRKSDIISFNEDTAMVLFLIINGNIVVETAGRMKTAPAKFEFSDAFEKGENIYGV